MSDLGPPDDEAGRALAQARRWAREERIVSVSQSLPRAREASVRRNTVLELRDLAGMLAEAALSQGDESLARELQAMTDRALALEPFSERKSPAEP